MVTADYAPDFEEGTRAFSNEETRAKLEKTSRRRQRKYKQLSHLRILVAITKTSHYGMSLIFTKKSNSPNSLMSREPEKFFIRKCF